MLNTKQVGVPEFMKLVSKKLQLDVVLDAGLYERHITDFALLKPGLALAGFQDHIVSGRAMLFGTTEITYLETISYEQAYENIMKLFTKNPTCIIVSKSLKIPEILTKTATEANIPILTTDERTRNTIYHSASILEEHLSEKAYIHGVMLDVYGMGVVITGKSGIGKSECAIELIKRGHRLVADDIIVAYGSQGKLIGTSNELLRHHIELRGVGIVNIRDMFGITAIREKKRIEFVINFTDTNETDIDRLGIDENNIDILGHKVPKITCEIFAGRNTAVIVEVAARNRLLKNMGYDSSKSFIEKADERLVNNKGSL